MSSAARLSAFSVLTLRAAVPISANRSAGTRRPPQLSTASLGRRECRSGSLRDGLGLVFSHGGENMHNEAISLGHIDGYELDAGLHEI
jgi:hypothetical protein